MGPQRTSLRFVVGTALLTATTAAAASGCDKPNVNTPAPDDRPNINTPPERQPAAGGSTGEPEVNPGQGPIVNTAAPPPAEPAPQRPIVNTPAPEPKPEPPIVNTRPELEPPTINTVTAPEPKRPKPADDKPKKIVNTLPDRLPD